MIRIAVVDDDEIYSYNLKNIIINFFNDNNINGEILIYNNGKDLLSECYKNVFDVLFLDIDMPDVTGIEVAEEIRKYNDNIMIIFITNMEQLVFESIKYSPFRFVKKQTMNEEITEVLNALSQKIVKDNLAYKFICNGTQISIRLSEIMYLEAFKHTIVLHQANKNEYKIPITLDHFQMLYESVGFLRIHKSYIVNYRYIYEINKNSLIITTSDEIPISRHRVPLVKQQYAYFTRRDIK